MGPDFQIRAGLLVFLAFSCFWQDTASQRCHTSWARIGGYCYGYMASPKTWDEAKKDCEKSGGHLATIASYEDLRALAKYILTTYNASPPIWIGLFVPRSDPKKQWTWVDGSPADFIRWNIFEPNNMFFNENCAELFTYDLLYWNDNNCSNKNSYLCRKVPHIKG